MELELESNTTAMWLNFALTTCFLNSAQLDIHSWLKCLYSKVNVAFDNSVASSIVKKLGMIVLIIYSSSEMG